MTADECDFEHEGYCCPPKEYAEFICEDSVLEDGLRRCNGDNNKLMTEEEWEAQQMEEKMRMSRDDWEMKGYQRK